jgi:autotransporter-associated beta strand protein
VANALPTGTTLNVSSTGTYDLNGQSQTVAGLGDGATATGVVTNGGGAATLTVNNATTNSFSGTISGANLALTKTGSGNLTLSGSNTYGGATTVNSGKLIVTGSISGSLFTVQNGATLAGNGTTGAVTAQSGAIVAPGDVSAGILNTGNFAENAGGALTIQLGGLMPGTQYDRLNVTGSVTLAGNLQRSLIGGFTPTIGDKFFIITNDGADAVSGTFTGLAQGSAFNIGSSWFQISYLGDSVSSSFTGGNDVVLLAIVPEPRVEYLFGCAALLLYCRMRRRLR